MADPAPTPSLRSRLTALKPAASKRRKVEARTLAIDGSATAVRALLCERAAGRITITRACELPIGADGERPDVRAAMGVVGVPCIVALSREESLLGRIELPTDDEAELETFVMFRRLLLVSWIGSHSATDLAQDMGDEYTAVSCELAETYLSRHG